MRTPRPDRRARGSPLAQSRGCGDCGAPSSGREPDDVLPDLPTTIPFEIRHGRSRRVLWRRWTRADEDESAPHGTIATTLDHEPAPGDIRPGTAAADSPPRRSRIWRFARPATPPSRPAFVLAQLRVEAYILRGCFCPGAAAATRMARAAATAASKREQSRSRGPARSGVCDCDRRARRGWRRRQWHRRLGIA